MPMKSMVAGLVRDRERIPELGLRKSSSWSSEEGDVPVASDWETLALRR